MSWVSPSLRTMKGIWLTAPVDRVAVRVEALQAGEVDTGDGVGRHVPAVGHRPVAGVDQAARGVDERVRLDSGVGVRPLGDLAGAAAAVVAKAEDLDLVVAARAAVDVDLEVNARAGVDAHVGGEAFDLRAVRYVPVRPVGTTLENRILLDNLVHGPLADTRWRGERSKLLDSDHRTPAVAAPQLPPRTKGSLPPCTTS